MLGIALVVEDANHGQRLAFRYPASSRMKISEKDKDKHDNNPYACLSKETDGDIYSDSNTSSSFLSGFFGGLSGNQGALRSAFLVKHGLEKSVFVATTVAISSLVDITRLSVYSANFLNLNYSDFYQLGFFSVISAVAGSFIGNKLLKKVTIQQIKKIVALLLILLGISLLIGIL